MQLITGNTYPVRRELRAMGGTWNKTKQAWEMPDERADEARSLVDDCGTARRNYQRKYTGTLERRGSGRGYIGTDRYGRAHFGTSCGCEDYPCCGH